MSSDKILATLRRVPLFQELSTDQLTELAAHVKTARYDAGEVLFTEGEAGRDLLVISAGSVRVGKSAASGRQQLLSIEREGSSLGEVSVFDGGCYSATAIAITPLEVLRVKGEQFRRFCSVHPDVAFAVIRVLGNRLQQARNLVEQLSFATVRGRLICASTAVGGRTWRCRRGWNRSGPG